MEKVYNQFAKANSVNSAVANEDLVENIQQIENALTNVIDEQSADPVANEPVVAEPIFVEPNVETNGAMVEANIESTVNGRKAAKRAMEQQAHNMIKRSKIILQPAKIHDTVLVHLDKVDKSGLDSPNLIALIIEAKEVADGNIVYRVATKDGVLKGWITRDQFDISKQKILKITQVNTTIELSKRTANSIQSLVGGQGFKFCNCTNECLGGRCGCFKANPTMKCNSKCHSGNKKCKNC